jgi:hypothetical protein
VLTVVTPQEPTPAATTTGGSLIDEIVRDGARRMLAAALEAEVAAPHRRPTPTSSTPKAAAWSCVTATPSRGR